MLQLARFRKIVVLTGAGVSVASGLRTYRGAGGLWTSGEENAALAKLEPMDPPNPAFREVRLGPAEALLPALFAT